jgi:hypothetical protein
VIKALCFKRLIEHLKGEGVRGCVTTAEPVMSEALSFAPWMCCCLLVRVLLVLLLLNATLPLLLLLL